MRVPRVKTLVPELPSQFVSRPRLLDVLDDRPAGVMLVSAPPGYGKTLLLVDWVHRAGTAAQRARAAAIAAHSRSTSLSPLSRFTHAVAAAPARCTQSTSSRVLPYPGGALTSITPSGLSASTSSRRGRETNCEGRSGTKVFIRGTRMPNPRLSMIGHGPSPMPLHAQPSRLWGRLIFLSSSRVDEAGGG